jgi:RHS repeat-associated protein
MSRPREVRQASGARGACSRLDVRGTVRPRLQRDRTSIASHRNSPGYACCAAHLPRIEPQAAVWHLVICLLAFAVSVWRTDASFGATTAVYVSQYFELRENGTPTKYVFDGATRTARVIGPLSANPLVQRFAVRTGWNLRSLAVTATNALDQLSSSLSRAVVGALYRWNPAASNFIAVTAAETLPAGTVVWLRASTNASLSVVGTYSQPANILLAPGGNFVASAGLENWSLSNALPATATVWRPAQSAAGWSTELGSPLGMGPSGTDSLGPGEAMFVSVSAPLELKVPDPSSRLLYYHDDHLGSATCLSDAQGRVVTETAYYPYGVERNTQALASDPSYYRFTRKERDAEHGLLNFESRLLWPAVARFLRVDSLADKFKAQSLHAPQVLNPYAYCQNNPLTRMDADGREARVIIHDDNRITIQVAIQYVGPMATKRNIAIANKGIEKYWTGKFGRYNVKMEVIDPAKDPSLKPAVVTLTSKDDKNKYLRSFVKIEADTGQWNPRDSDFAWTAAHETGHLMGLDDRYTDKKGADKGWRGNMMAEDWGRVEERNIKELVSPSKTVVGRVPGREWLHHRSLEIQTTEVIKAREAAALERDMAIQLKAWELSDK